MLTEAGRQGPDFRKSSHYQLLCANFAQKGCAICRIGQAAVAKFLDALFFENVNDPGVRQDLKASLGFCYVHSQDVLRFGDPLGNAIIHKMLLDEFVQRLHDDTSWSHEHAPLMGHLLSRHGKGEHSHLRPDAPCPACEVKRLREADHTDFLLTHLSDPQLQAAYRDSSGMCAHHVATGMEVALQAQQTENARLLKEIEEKIIANLKGELEELMRKNDYRFALEAQEGERDSWIRAIWKISGFSPERG